MLKIYFRISVVSLSKLVKKKDSFVANKVNYYKTIYWGWCSWKSFISFSKTSNTVKVIYFSFFFSKTTKRLFQYNSAKVGVVQVKHEQ